MDGIWMFLGVSYTNLAILSRKKHLLTIRVDGTKRDNIVRFIWKLQRLTSRSLFSALERIIEQGKAVDFKYWV